MKKIPFDMQTFKEIIEGGYVYVDKTRFVYKMASTGKAYFLSRPSSFGKSLLLSTFESLFSGPPDPDGPPQGLFRDLWIGRSDYDFSQKFPVVTLDMNLESSTPERLRDDIEGVICHAAFLHGLDVEAASLGGLLIRLFKSLKEKYNSNIVLLIDDYDSVINYNIENCRHPQKLQTILKNFYSKLKSCDKYLRFIFVTGTTYYGFTGLSAGLNNLNDITFDPEYNNICCFTEFELEDCFKNYMPFVLEKMKSNGAIFNDANVSDMLVQIKEYFSGYSWGGEDKVLNPYSILKCLERSDFSDYWFKTYPPITFLMDFIDENHNNPLSLLDKKFDYHSQKTLGFADVGSPQTVPGLFQTGYLTLDQGISDPSEGRLFSLRIPNWEVENIIYEFFSDMLFGELGRSPETERDVFMGAVRERDSDRLTKIISSVFGVLPAAHHGNSESYYHRVLYGYCRQFGRIFLPEAPGTAGTSDLAIVFPGLFVVIEVEFSAGSKSSGQGKLLEKTAEKALKAIDAKEHWRPYRGYSEEFVGIGLGVTLGGQCLALIGG
ncbi:MAG: AAA family ATPase [Deltaproteobacteria bacterium]|jgi:hypothetical protein|nr:AAA family ATPase [Deltaproteobacteria bacterium]